MWHDTLAQRNLGWRIYFLTHIKPFEPFLLCANSVSWQNQAFILSFNEASSTCIFKTLNIWPKLLGLACECTFWWLNQVKWIAIFHNCMHSSLLVLSSNQSMICWLGIFVDIIGSVIFDHQWLMWRDKSAQRNYWWHFFQLFS